VTVWGVRLQRWSLCLTLSNSSFHNTEARKRASAINTAAPRALPTQVLRATEEPGNTTAKWRTLSIRKHLRASCFYRLCLGKLVDG